MSRCCSIACYVLFSVLSFLRAITVRGIVILSDSAPLSLTSSLQPDHVQVVERHQMPVTAEDVHVSLRIDDTDVAVTRSWLSSTDEAKFVLV